MKRREETLIHNSLAVTGSDSQIERVHMAIAGSSGPSGREVPLDFATILPPPAALLDGEEANLRDWCLAEWGTPGNALGSMVRRTPGRLAVIFESELRPPVEFVARLAHIFPGAEFELAWSPGTGGELRRIIFRRGRPLQGGGSPEKGVVDPPDRYTLLPFRVSVQTDPDSTQVRIVDIRNHNYGHYGARGPVAAVYGSVYDLLRKAEHQYGPGYIQRLYCLASTVLADRGGVGPDGQDQLPPAGRGWYEIHSNGIARFQQILDDILTVREKETPPTELPLEHGLYRTAGRVAPEDLRLFAYRIVPCHFYLVLEADLGRAGSFSVALGFEDDIEARLRGSAGQAGTDGPEHFTALFKKYGTQINPETPQLPVTGTTAALMRGEAPFAPAIRGTYP